MTKASYNRYGQSTKGVAKCYSCEKPYNDAERIFVEKQSRISLVNDLNKLSKNASRGCMVEYTSLCSEDCANTYIKNCPITKEDKHTNSKPYFEYSEFSILKNVKVIATDNENYIQIGFNNEPSTCTIL